MFLNIKIYPLLWKVCGMRMLGSCRNTAGKNCCGFLQHVLLAAVGGRLDVFIFLCTLFLNLQKAAENPRFLPPLEAFQISHPRPLLRPLMVQE